MHVVVGVAMHVESIVPAIVLVNVEHNVRVVWVLVVVNVHRVLEPARKIVQDPVYQPVVRYVLIHVLIHVPIPAYPIVYLTALLGVAVLAKQTVHPDVQMVVVQHVLTHVVEIVKLIVLQDALPVALPIAQVYVLHRVVRHV